MNLKIKTIILMGCAVCTSLTYAGLITDSGEALPGDNTVVKDIEHAVRRALVIGNADYQSGQLINPVKDARAISTTLKQLGFEVTKLENANREQMVQAIRTFNELLNNQAIGVYYFSGHGIRYGGNNYLLPVDFSSEGSLPYDAVDTSILLNNNAVMNLLFLDASFSRGGKENNSSFASISGGKSNTLVSYATDANSYAIDSANKADNSPYTAALLKWMNKPDLPIEAALKKVRNEVKKDTQNRQFPWYESSLDGDFYFDKEKVDIDE